MASLGNVAQAADLGCLTGRLQADSDTGEADLRTDPIEVLVDARHDLLGRLVSHRSEVSDDDSYVQFGSEFDGVLDGRPALLCFGLILHRQHGKVRGVGG